MARERNPNLEALMLAVDRLGGLADQMVFLGGSATGLLITDPAAPYFLITKLTAFEGRGHGDYHMSHDMEDIIAVIDGRPNIVDEVSKAKPRLRKELSMRFQRLLEDARFLDAVPGHMPTDAASQARVGIILRRLEALAER